jgi:hypothetical protein
MKRSREPEEALPEEVTLAAANDHGGLTQLINGDGLPPAAKIAELDLADDANDRNIEMRCSLPPHKEPVVFSSYAEYEVHYRDQHTNRCVQCRKNFPSTHLLGLHIEETHDSFAQLRREKGERTVSSRSPVPLASPPAFQPLTARLSTHASWKAARGNAARHRSEKCT